MNLPCTQFLFFLLLFIPVRSQEEEQEGDGEDKSVYLLVKINSKNDESVFPEFDNNQALQSSPFYNKKTSALKNLASQRADSVTAEQCKRDCKIGLGVVSTTCAAVSAVLCIFSFGIGCAVSAICTLAGTLPAWCDLCSKTHQSRGYNFDAELNSLNDILYQTQKLERVQKLMGPNQIQMNKKIKMVQKVIQGLQRGMGSQRFIQEKSYKTNNVLGKNQSKIKTRGEIQAKGNNKGKTMKDIFKMDSNYMETINETQRFLFTNIQKMINQSESIQVNLIKKGYNITLFGDDIQNLLTLREKFNSVLKYQISRTINNDSKEFQETALGSFNGEEIANNIFNMLTGNHIYKKGSKFCAQEVKDYYNSLMVEGFLYFATAKAMAGESVSQESRSKLDKHIVDHESNYLKHCGCPESNMQLKNRGSKSNKIVTALLNSGYDEENGSPISDGSNAATSSKSFPLKLISEVTTIDFSNEELVTLIRESRIEDIELIAQLFLFNTNKTEIQRQIELFDNSLGCFRKNQELNHGKSNR